MSKTIKVNIGGKELNLRGDNEQQVMRAATEVNSIIQQLQQRMQDQSTSTLSVLAALNIAEKYNENKEQHEADTKYLSAELSAMTEYLEQCASSETS